MHFDCVDANEIRLKQEELSVAAIKQFFLDCDGDYARYDVLVELYSLMTSMCQAFAVLTCRLGLTLLVFQSANLSSSSKSAIPQTRSPSG